MKSSPKCSAASPMQCSVTWPNYHALSIYSFPIYPFSKWSLNYIPSSVHHSISFLFDGARVFKCLYRKCWEIKTFTLRIKKNQRSEITFKKSATLIVSLFLFLSLHENWLPICQTNNDSASLLRFTYISIKFVDIFVVVVSMYSFRHFRIIRKLQPAFSICLNILKLIPFGSNFKADSIWILIQLYYLSLSLKHFDRKKEECWCATKKFKC